MYLIKPYLVNKVIHNEREIIMKTILWISRHTMTQEQENDLKRIYGEDIKIKQYDNTVNSVNEIVTIGEDCDIFAVVLPPTIIMDLVNPRNNTKPVIRSCMSRIETGNTTANPATGLEEKEYRMIFEAWEQVNKFIVDVTRL